LPQRSQQSLPMHRSRSHITSIAAEAPASPWPTLAHRETLSRTMTQNPVPSSQRTAASSEHRKISVLAFGDSLTLGMIIDSTNRPYGSRLADLLGVPPESVTTSGRAGQLTRDMAQRLHHELQLRRFKPFTHVVILGGTNDLREGLPPKTVVGHLTLLYNMVRASGAKCVAVTIPRFGPRDATNMPMKGPRDQVNSVLRAMAASPGEGKRPLLQLADLDQAIECLPASERNSLFSDTVHFGARGYELLGDLAYKAITGKAVSTASCRTLPVPEGVRTATVFLSGGCMVGGSTVRRPWAPTGSTMLSQPSAASLTWTGRSGSFWTQSTVRRSAAGQQCQLVAPAIKVVPIATCTKKELAPILSNWHYPKSQLKN